MDRLRAGNIPEFEIIGSLRLRPKPNSHMLLEFPQICARGSIHTSRAAPRASCRAGVETLPVVAGRGYARADRVALFFDSRPVSGTVVA